MSRGKKKCGSKPFAFVLTNMIKDVGEFFMPGNKLAGNYAFDLFKV
jgi:hypothetical protein